MRVSPLVAAFFGFSWLIFMGLMPTLMGDLNASYRRQKVRFVQLGKTTTARVMSKTLRDPAISYRYRVGGRGYEGGAFVANKDWIGLQVGGPVEIVYDPDDPAKSDYRPQKWLDDQEHARRTSRWVAIGGVVGLVVSTIVALGRRMGYFGPETLWAGLVTPMRVVGAVFFVGPMAMQVSILRDHFGEGLVWQVNEGPPHIASGWEVLGASAFIAIFWGVGLALLVFGGSAPRGSR